MNSTTNVGDTGASEGESYSTMSFGRGGFLNEGVQTSRL